MKKRKEKKRKIKKSKKRAREGEGRGRTHRERERQRGRQRGRENHYIIILLFCVYLKQRFLKWTIGYSVLDVCYVCVVLFDVVNVNVNVHIHTFTHSLTHPLTPPRTHTLNARVLYCFHLHPSLLAPLQSTLFSLTYTHTLSLSLSLSTHHSLSHTLSLSFSLYSLPSTHSSHSPTAPSSSNTTLLPSFRKSLPSLHSWLLSTTYHRTAHICAYVIHQKTRLTLAPASRHMSGKPIFTGQQSIKILI
jgi:hypothetical protein